MPDSPSWLTITRNEAPLILSVPHAGTTIPPELQPGLVSLWRARCDADWWVDRLYDFAAGLGATIIATRISRTVIDVNRDPSGASLYPGMVTTELCPLTTFDGLPLYESGREPGADAIPERRKRFFEPYHAALQAEIDRLHSRYGHVVLYDCHSIRSRIPRLFEGELPNFNIGTFNGRSCSPELTRVVETACAVPGFSQVTNGRFCGGYITRHYGRPADGVHAIQMELAMRGYLREPAGEPLQSQWPPPYDEAFAEPMRAILARVLNACLAFVRRAAG